MKNTWQKNCYENWKRIKYKTNWNDVYWLTLWIIVSLFYLVASYNNFTLIGYILLLNCWISADKEEKIYVC